MYVLLMVCAAHAQSASHHNRVRVDHVRAAWPRDAGRARAGRCRRVQHGEGRGAAAVPSARGRASASGTGSSMAARGVIMKRRPWCQIQYSRRFIHGYDRVVTYSLYI